MKRCPKAAVLRVSRSVAIRLAALARGRRRARAPGAAPHLTQRARLCAPSPRARPSLIPFPLLISPCGGGPRASRPAPPGAPLSGAPRAAAPFCFAALPLSPRLSPPRCAGSAPNLRTPPIQHILSCLGRQLWVGRTVCTGRAPGRAPSRARAARARH
ncbi:MAG: hypothetical protein J3K34DRAFT_442540, partial [Monoraphidium minutum]